MGRTGDGRSRSSVGGKKEGLVGRTAERVARQGDVGLVPIIQGIRGESESEPSVRPSGRRPGTRPSSPPTPTFTYPTPLLSSKIGDTTVDGNHLGNQGNLSISTPLTVKLLRFDGTFENYESYIDLV